MITLLFEAKRLDEHEKLVAKALYVPGVKKSFLYNEIAMGKEVRGNYVSAIKYYRMAARWSMDLQEIETIKENIRRAKSKRWLFLNI
jgi:hypothetical protein